MSDSRTDRAESTCSKEMPRYICHKTVWAIQIAGVEMQTDGTARIHPSDIGYSSFRLTSDEVRRFKPQAGGYLVTYDDGYKSYSPQAAFEAGYTKL